MRRLWVFGALLLFIETAPLRAQNPDDLQFRAAFLSDSNTYHIGEPIPMEISYASQADKKYHGSFSTPQPERGGIAINITPDDGFLDPRRLLGVIGWAGSFASTSGYVTPQPHRESFDLTEWFRFQKPGHYSITVTSNRISRIRSLQEGGGMEPLTLESDPVDLNIIPAEPGWVATQMEEIDQALRAGGGPEDRELAIRRLGLLDTFDSAQRLIQLYMQSPDLSRDWSLVIALQESTQLDTIIAELQLGLRNPQIATPDTLIDVLATLQTRQKLGNLPAYPSALEQQAVWDEKRKSRDKVHDDFVAQDTASLVATMQQRSGTARAAGLYQAWTEAERLNAISPLPEERLQQLRTDVLSVAGDLSHAQQTQLLVSDWRTTSHDQLLPLILNLTRASPDDGGGYEGQQAYQLWCEDWPFDCEAAIIAEVSASKIQTSLQIILLLHDAERPQLDALLKQALTNPQMDDSAQSQRVAALLMRAGSRNVAPSVEAILDKRGNPKACFGGVEGYLIGYLLRVSREDAQKRLDALLQNGKGFCGSEVLRTLNTSQFANAMVPAATRALFAPNTQAAGSAALFLAEHGSSSDTREILWKRLAALWKEWENRSAALAGPFEVRTDSTAGQAELLEEELASALAHAKNWKLSPDEQERLRDGCLTERCRAIADGKRFLGL